MLLAVDQCPVKGACLGHHVGLMEIPFRTLALQCILEFPLIFVYVQYAANDVASEAKALHQPWLLFAPRPTPSINRSLPVFKRHSVEHLRPWNRTFYRVGWLVGRSVGWLVGRV